MTAYIKDTATLARIKLRCIECGDCHEWQGGFAKPKSGTVYPTVRIAGKAKMVRRVVYVAAKGPIRAKHAIRVTCENQKCVNPGHLVMSTTAQIAQIAAKAGKISSLARCAKIANSKRARGSKLTPELAMEIRESDESGPVLAARHGIHRTLAVRIKAGKAWRDYTNPFLGLGVR